MPPFMPPFMPGSPLNPFSDDSDLNGDDKDYSLVEDAISNAEIENDSKHRTVEQYLDDHDEDCYGATIISDDDFDADIGNTVYHYDNGMKIEASKDATFIDTVKMVQKPDSDNW